jgi:hypothetical protein
MARSKPKRSPRKKPQKYDTSFKDWVDQQPYDILPLLLPGAVYEKTLTVETSRSMMRADKVFKILYSGEEHILHLEFQTGSDAKLRSRLLVYNSVLYQDYQLPVLTIVIYPFQAAPAESPLSIVSNKKEVLTFHFRTLSLFTLDAEKFVQEHRACMYPILPTMRGVHAELILQVMQELIELYRDNEVNLAQQYAWMTILLERTGTIEPLEKEKIQERLSMYDQLWEESPRVQKMKEQVREQVRAETEARTLRRALVSMVRARFPSLTEFAQQQVELFDNPGALDLLIQQVAKAPDANAVRWLLDSNSDE